MTTTLRADLVDARLLGIFDGDRVGSPYNFGECYAFLSAETRTVTIVDLRAPGTPVITGSLTLPDTPEGITADYDTGMVVYVIGSGKLWTIQLDASFVPTLTSTRDIPTANQGGIDMIAVDGTYIASYGPAVKGSFVCTNGSTLYVHDKDRQLIHVYSTTGEAPWLVLEDSIPTPGAQMTKAFRVGVDATSPRLYLLTDDFIHTFDISVELAPTLTSSVRHREAVLTDIYSGLDTVNGVFLQHIGGRPPIDGQTGAPLYIADEDFVVAIGIGTGLLFIVADKDLGKLTVWRQ